MTKKTQQKTPHFEVTHELFLLGEGSKQCHKTLNAIPNMQISEDQFEIIRQFASTRKTADLKTVYKINDAEFMVIPRIQLGEVKMYEYKADFNFTADGLPDSWISVSKIKEKAPVKKKKATK